MPRQLAADVATRGHIVMLSPAPTQPVGNARPFGEQALMFIGTNDFNEIISTATFARRF